MGQSVFWGYRHAWYSLQLKGHWVPRQLVEISLRDMDRLKRHQYHNRKPNAAACGWVWQAETLWFSCSWLHRWLEYTTFMTGGYLIKQLPWQCKPLLPWCSEGFQRMSTWTIRDLKHRRWNGTIMPTRSEIFPHEPSGHAQGCQNVVHPSSTMKFRMVCCHRQNVSIELYFLRLNHSFPPYHSVQVEIYSL